MIQQKHVLLFNWWMGKAILGSRMRVPAEKEHLSLFLSLSFFLDLASFNC